MIGLSTAASKLPPQLTMAGVRLEVAQTPDAHQSLAQETKEYLAQDNVDSVIVGKPNEPKSVLIKPEPLDPDKPVNSLTSLSKALLKSGCSTHFFTGHYLADIGAFNAVPAPELGGQTNLSLPWVELRDNHAPLETLTMHEVRHFHQHRSRLAARAHSGGAARPDVRVKFTEDTLPDNWLGRTEGYNGALGHSTDEVDAYLYQSKLHLHRAQRKAKIDPATAREDAGKAVSCACKAFLFADSDAAALRMESPAVTPIDGELRKYAGDRLLTENGVGAFVDSLDFPEGDLVGGLRHLADDLTKDGQTAKSVAGTALQLLSKDPGAVEVINQAIAEIKAVGWIKG